MCEPHVILLVIRLDVRFTEEENKANEWIQKNFGKEAQGCTVVLFTHGELLTNPIESHLKCCPTLQRLVDKYKGVYDVFKNTQQDQVQVYKIDELRQMNGNHIYTSQKSWLSLDAVLGFSAGAAVAAVGGIITAAVKKS